MSAALWIYRHLSAYMWRARKKYALINKKKSQAPGDDGGGEIMAQSKNKKYINKFLIHVVFFTFAYQRKKIVFIHKVIEKFIQKFFFFNGDKLFSCLIIFKVWSARVMMDDYESEDL